MRSKLVDFRWWMTLSALAGAVLSSNAAPATGRPAGRSIEFSSVEDDTASTNSPQALARAEALKQAEQDLRPSLNIFSLGGSSEILQAPATYFAPRPLSKQTLEQIDRNKNWMLMTPEELLLGKSDNDPLKVSGAGKHDASKPSREEEYYLGKSETKPNSAANPWRESEQSPWRLGHEELGDHDDSATVARLKADEQELKKLTGNQDLKSVVPSDLDDRALPADTRPAGFSDIFHMGGGTTAADVKATLQHEAMMQDFRRANDMPLDRPKMSFRSDQSTGLEGPMRPSADAFGLRAKQSDKPNPLSRAYGTLPPIAPGAPQKTFGSTSLVPPSTFDTTPQQTNSAPPRPTFLAPKRPFF